MCRKRWGGAIGQTHLTEIFGCLHSLTAPRFHPPLIIWCIVPHGSPWDCLSLSTCHASWDKRPFIICIIQQIAYAFQHFEALFWEMFQTSFGWSEQCFFRHQNSSMSIIIPVFSMERLLFWDNEIYAGGGWWLPSVSKRKVMSCSCPSLFEINGYKWQTMDIRKKKV